MDVVNTFNKLNSAHPYQTISPYNKKIIGMEGGSRSAKTRQIIKYLLLFSQKNSNSGLTTRIFREDNKNCMSTVFEDFITTLDEVKQYSRKNYLATKQTYNHFGNRFKFHGLDDKKAHGLASDVSYFNEALDMNSDAAFKQINMRCNMLSILDWNPRCTDHWVFDLEKRPDAIFIHSTWRDNALIPPGQLQEILAYEPTAENIKNGTADEYMYKVYNLGLRASLTGLIYPNITWINDDEWPNDVDWTSYGMDFGHTISPTAIVRCAAIGRDLYVKGLFYEPCDNPVTLNSILTPILGETHVWADCAERDLINLLRVSGLYVLPAPKPVGSINAGIDIMKSYNIHIVRNIDFKKEADNYKWREVGGIALNEPVKQYNHYWDAARYCVMNEAYLNA